MKCTLDGNEIKDQAEIEKSKKELKELEKQFNDLKSKQESELNELKENLSKAKENVIRKRVTVQSCNQARIKSQQKSEKTDHAVTKTKPKPDLDQSVSEKLLAKIQKIKIVIKINHKNKS